SFCGGFSTTNTVNGPKQELNVEIQIKMKLANLGHAQTTETRLKIGARVKMGWIGGLEKRCCRKEELQWNSYGILDKQLKQEWSECVEQRKQMVRPPGSKRAPKSPKQRRKIAEAIAAKWADPDWEVLDTRLNADDMKLVANAYRFLKDGGFLPNFFHLNLSNKTARVNSNDRTDEDAFK
ncbi:hypothetical protein S83_051193, partial [Arachis hypogaea]